MKPSIQSKIDRLKRMAKVGASSKKEEVNSRADRDSLSLAIRSKRDADIFRTELSLAFKAAKKAKS